MSRGGRRLEQPASSHWEPGYHSYSDEYSLRRYAPPAELLPRNTFNYWRNEAAPPTSYYPQRPYGRGSHNEQWRDDSRPWHAESSYSRRRRDFGPARDWDDRESWGDRSLPHRTPPRQRYPAYTPPPHIPQATFRGRYPMESALPIPKTTLLDPPRKTSPPPNKSSQPLKPSLGYLSLSQQPSEVLRDLPMTRKLIVLDLNGTLLIRSPRSRTSSGPRLRPVQPRPYMQSFRQYLFCLETKAWLDTMVWSSAQPHSVDDMVDKVFGTTKGELKAVWNRKSLGLSEADYHQKAVTTKDLTKPWDLFASALSHENPEGHSAVPPYSQIIHSAFTTLLLDDSPHKAVLQPYNHLCIPEYNSTRRQHDLRTFLAKKEPEKGKTRKKATQKNQAETSAHSTGQMVSELPSRDAPSELAEKEPYDAVLLAVVGILEAVKLQSNVAGWIRKGRLWATQERLGEGSALDVNDVKAVDGKTVSNALVQTGNDASSTSDPTVTPEQAHLQTKMWFDDSSALAYWVARGRRALMELGIPVAHGVTS